MSEAFLKYDYDVNIKLNNFEKYMIRQDLARFSKIYRKI